MKKTVTVALLLLTAALLMQAVGFAWLSDNGLSSPIDITSNVHKTYFAGGDGSKETPYVISTPLQLYYFAWLQYLGYFNLDENEDGVIDSTVYFVLSNDINMHVIDENGEEMDYVLPPIGTTDTPFLGNFDGGGHTVENAIVENRYSSLIEPPEGTSESNFSGVEVIGFFGVVGSLPEDTYTYDSQVNEVKNLVLKNLTVKTQTERSLIGLVAGYVNGTVDCVGVVGGTVNIKDGVKALSYTANISDYSLVGYCTDAFKDSVYVMDVVLSDPGISDQYTVVPEVGGDGDAHGWGGSVKMKDIFNLMQNVRTTSNNRYTLERTDVVGLSGKTVTIDTGDNQTKNSATVSNFGSFVFTNMTWNNNIINFVSGSQKVTKYEYAYSDSNVTVYYISDGTNYLGYNGTAITNTTDQSLATKWYVSNGTNGGNIFTVVNDNIYYLTMNGNTITTVTEFNVDRSALPVWTVSGGKLSFEGTGIAYSGSSWGVAVGAEGVKISITSGSTRYYLSTNGTNGAQTITSESEAAVWTIAAVNGGYTVSTVIGGVTYYLGHTSLGNNQDAQAKPTLSNTTQTVWQFSNNQLTVQNGSTTHYLRYSNSGGGFVVQSYNSNNTLTLTQSTASSAASAAALSSAGTQSAIVCNEDAYIDNSIENYTYNQNGEKVVTGAGLTYMPLAFENTSGNYTVANSNTGYIIGSQWGAIEKSEYDGNGNIRIARYTASNMSNYTTPYTVTYKTRKTSDRFQTINENPTAEHLATLGLQKYADCYKDFRTSITADNNCYGLHFMTASVSMTNLVEINAHLNGEDIANYQMPTNCIDFNLYDRGFINFVAGSYYTAQTPNNDSFFSIYEILRDGDKKITAIKEIRKIYAKVNSTTGDIETGYPYVYTYREGNNEVGLENVPAGYEVVFDCRWITHTKEDFNNKGWENNRAYYFEVPVNAGEYAIGSTEGRTGAYLVYLDLAANAQLIERHKEYEKIVEETTAATLPNGVELLPSNDLTSIDPADSVYVSINTNGNGQTMVSGDISYSTTDGVTTTHTAKGGTSAEYIGIRDVLLDGNGHEMSVQGVITTTERTTYRDYNINTRETVVTVISKITVLELDGTQTVTYTRTITKTSAEGEVTEQTTDPQAQELFPETPDTDTALSATVGADLINLYFAYGQEVPLTVTYLYVPAVTDENGSVTQAPQYRITVTNGGDEAIALKAVLTQTGATGGITFLINGTALENVTTAQIIEIAAADSGAEEPAEGELTE